MFGSSGDGSEVSDELKEEGDLVVGVDRNQAIVPRTHDPQYSRDACACEKVEGALAEAQSCPASYELVNLLRSY
jgi:hypothetical protein